VSPTSNGDTGRKRSWLGRLLAGWLNVTDRAAVFTEAAGAATDAHISYWVVLTLAGAIAALGLALNSAAVVIGAMLIAPLLAPVVGLALALAMGDGRLAVETALIILVSTLAVVVTGALLTLALPSPFRTLTPEIASRTRPTTLDLGIAGFSGLAGAAITVTRSRRLSGAAPGVAVSVALVPPLAAAGYGIGSGWNWSIVRGSLLLYGANLAGIVMSAMAVFLIAGMRRPEVLEVDRQRLREAPPSVLTAWVERVPGLRSLGIMKSTWARLALVGAFVALVAIPLRESLREIARESRVKQAISDATQMFTRPGHSFVVSHDVELGDGQTHVVLNVATTGWFGDSVRREFQRRASAAAREPVTLTLEQLPASSTDVSQLAALLSAPQPAPARVVAPAPAARARIDALRAQVNEIIGSLTLPDSFDVAGSELTLGDSVRGTALHIAYVAPESLSTQAQQMLAGQIAGALAVPTLHVTTELVSSRIRPVSSLRAPAVDSAVTLLRRYPGLRVEVLTDSATPRSRADSLAARLASVRAPADSAAEGVTMRNYPGRGLALRMRGAAPR
jgi:uncharacterized hydrophobic protein (TIGR00271 family)